MTIAVTPFDGFCGFRPLQQIASFLGHVPELRSLVGDAEADRFARAVSAGADSSDPQVVSSNKAALKALFAALMKAPEPRVQELTAALAASARASPATCGGPEYGGAQLAELLLRLDAQFPRDIGLFCALFLNYVTLQPGEAIFLQANDPHAYLSGDVVECMAASDNVVRAGLTPKFKDVDNLVDMLTYSYAPIEAQKMKPVPWGKASGNGTTILYDPPIDEFAVVRTELPAGEAETFEPVQGPSVVLVTEGGGSISHLDTEGNGVGPKTELLARAGLIFFVGATARLQMAAGPDGLVAFRAFCEL